MKIGAVICEYNPFHRGHAYLLSCMHEVGFSVVALMSGSFTQRGSCAILSKYERAAAACQSGANLVLELPFPFSASRADRFAAGGVDLAASLGLVDALCFGSETGDAEALRRAALLQKSEAFAAALREELGAGQDVAYRVAWDAAVRRICGGATGALGSNDRLGVFYIARMMERQATFAPIAFRRLGEAFDGTAASPSDAPYAAASSIRRWIDTGAWEKVYGAVPPAMAERLQTAREHGRIADEEKLFRLFAASVRAGRLTLSEKTPDCTAELAARMETAAWDAETAERFLSLAETRRYSASRIRRVMLASLLGVESPEGAAISYTQVLAADSTGREILAAARKTATIPILTKPSDYKLCDERVRRDAALAARADAVWELLCDVPRAGGAMLREKPILI